MRMSVRDLKSKFMGANPGLKENMFGVNCSGKFLSEVNVCMAKDLGFRACSPNVRDSCASDFIVQPVR